MKHEQSSAFDVGADRPQRRRVAVIGAGAAGLAAMKELKEQGHEVTGFEASDGIGGVYRSHYGALRLTSSSLITSYGAHPHGKEADPTIWTRDEYLDYLDSYARRFGLHDNLRIQTRVTRIEPHGERPTWRIHWQDVVSGTQGEMDVDAIAICSGVHSEAKIPDLPGFETFDGIVQHSSTFKSEDDFTGENVVVVGLGESGSDIALFTAMSAAKVVLSTRSGPGYIIPRFLFGKPSDVDTNRCYHAIPKKYADHPILTAKVRLLMRYLTKDDDPLVLMKADEINRQRGLSSFQRFGTKNTSLVEAMVYHGAEYRPDIERFEGRRIFFRDGSTFEADRIVFCTGYRANYPFLKDCPMLAAGGANSRTLYKRMIHPDLGPSVAWLGLVRPGFGSIPPMAEMQARYFAQLVSGNLQLPTRKAMLADIQKHLDADFAQYPHDAPNIRALTDYLRFMDSMAKAIGCQPRMTRLFFTRPKLWFQVLFAPLTATQYRLRGPGATPGLAAEVLGRLPSMPLPVLVHEFVFLAGARIVDGWQAFWARLRGSKSPEAVAISAPMNENVPA